MKTWANVDLSNHDEAIEFFQEEAKRAGERITAEQQRLQAKGILDANWQRVKKDKSSESA